MKSDKLEKGDATPRHYELTVETDEEGLGHLTLARLVKLAKTRTDEDIPKEQLTALACRMYDARRARARFLPNSMLGEPVWDMLLALYCLPSRRQRLSITGLCHAAGVPPSTALRWANLMEERGLMERTDDPCDRRRAHVALTEQGHEMMSTYLSSVYRIVTVS
jgi:DNA-binding MarR family transcriptional regulator